MSNLDAVHRHIREQFDLARKLHERPRIVLTVHIKPDITLADKAAPILSRLAPMPSKHLRRDCVSYEIVEPNVRDLNALFDEALISLGFKSEVVR